MQITQVFVVILLVGLHLSAVAADCSFNLSQRHCTCSLLDQDKLGGLIQCFSASTLELRGGNLEEFAHFASIPVEESVINILKILNVTKIVFGDLHVPEVLVAGVMRFMPYMHVTELEFENFTFLGQASWFQLNKEILPVSSLRFHKVTSRSLADRDKDFSYLSAWLQSLQDLTVTQSQVTYIPCSMGKIFRTLRYLDVSENPLQDQGVNSSFCPGAFPELQVLKLRHNNLSSIPAMCEMLHRLEKLRHLDLSHNGLQTNPSSSCEWQPSLRTLNLSATGLDHVPRPLPTSLEVLDVSSNNLLVLSLALPFLKELFLSNNRLQAIPSARNYPAIEALGLDGNLISCLPRGELQTLRHLRSLRVGRNPYNCTCAGACELSRLAHRGLLMPDWPQDYTCAAPPRHQGTLLKDAFAAELQCSQATALAPVSVLLLSCLAAALCLAQSRVRPGQLLGSGVRAGPFVQQGRG